MTTAADLDIEVFDWPAGTVHLRTFLFPLDPGADCSVGDGQSQQMKRLVCDRLLALTDAH